MAPSPPTRPRPPSHATDRRIFFLLQPATPSARPHPPAAPTRPPAPSRPTPSPRPTHDATNAGPCPDTPGPHAPGPNTSTTTGPTNSPPARTAAAASNGPGGPAPASPRTSPTTSRPTSPSTRSTATGARAAETGRAPGARRLARRHPRPPHRRPVGLAPLRPRRHHPADRRRLQRAPETADHRRRADPDVAPPGPRPHPVVRTDPPPLSRRRCVARRRDRVAGRRPDVVAVVLHPGRRDLLPDRRLTRSPGPRPVLPRGVQRGPGERLLGGLRRGRTGQAEVLAAPAAGVDVRGQRLGRGRRLADLRPAVAAGVRRRGASGTDPRGEAVGRVRPEAGSVARPGRRPEHRRLVEPARPSVGEAVAQVRCGVADVRGVRGRTIEQQPRRAGGPPGGADAEGEFREPERAWRGDASHPDERVPNAEDPRSGPAASARRCSANQRDHRDTAPAAGESQFRRLKGYVYRMSSKHEPAGAAAIGRPRGLVVSADHQPTTARMSSSVMTR